jgi:hypothetical protein
MANPDRLSQGEVIAGRYISETGITFGDGSLQNTTASPQRYISCFDLTVQSGSTTTPTPYKFGVTDFSRHINVISDGTALTKIKFDFAGIYNFIWSGQFKNTNIQSKDIYVWFRINGVDVAGSTGLAAVPLAHAGTTGHTIIGWNFFLNLNAGDEVQMMWMKESDDVSLAFFSGTANYPSTASIVLTVNAITG